jgi:hypothetical protein
MNIEMVPVVELSAGLGTVKGHVESMLIVIE